MSQVRFIRHRGAGSRDGYAAAYRGPMGDRQLLRDETGKTVVFSKRDIHAGNYNARSSESRRVDRAMNSDAWDDL